MNDSAMGDTDRFKRWLATQVKRIDAGGQVARDACAGKVRFNKMDDPLTRQVLFDLRLEWRRSEAKRKPTVNRSRATPAAKPALRRNSSGPKCPGCGDVGGTRRVETVATGQIQHWHERCLEADRARRRRRARRQSAVRR